ncbi:DUF4013 domain-containing protein [Methanobrevibacter sp.]
MASITDCVVEGLKYPFNDIKKLLGLGVLFAIINLLSMFFAMNTFDMYRVVIHVLENTTVPLSSLNMSIIPSANIYTAVGITIVGLIVGLFILGYQYNILSFSIDRKDDLPGFGDVVDIFVKGIKYFIVSVAYNLPAMIVMAAAMMFLDNLTVMSVLMVVSFVLLVIGYFLLVMALNNMVAHDSVGKAFDFREIIDNISNLGWGKYIGTILFTVIVFMIINVAVGLVLSLLAVAFAAVIINQAFAVSIFIGVIEALFVSPYCAVFFNRVCGSIYRESIK